MLGKCQCRDTQITRRQWALEKKKASPRWEAAVMLCSEAGMIGDYFFGSTFASIAFVGGAKTLGS